MIFQICKWFKMYFKCLYGFILCKNEVVNKNSKFD